MSAYELGVFLRKTINDQRLSISALSRQTSLSRETIYKLLRGDVREPDLSTLIRLSRGLRVHPILLFRKLFEDWEFSENGEKGANKRDSIGFLGDVNYPDYSLVPINKRFEKIWEIQNIGHIPWVGRRIICIDEEIEIRPKSPRLSGISRQRGLVPACREIPLPRVTPGESIKVAVELQAPPYPCTAISYWKMVDGNGDYCFPELEGLSCLVQVTGF